MSLGNNPRAAAIADGRATAVIYAIYPRSFRAAQGGAEGDIRGVIEGLDHIAALGADAIWLGPFYPSPMVDGGYDVADHCAVNPAMGRLEDIDRLIAAAHERGLSLMADLVFNHTADTHPWFEAAIAGDPAYRDFYVFADARPDGSPPTNWLSFFGTPGWRWIPQRCQYVLTQFLPGQPGLNLRCPAVQEALRGIVDFWCARGIDGFRLDAVASYLADEHCWHDNPAASPAARACNPAPDNNPYAWQDHRFDMLPGDGAAFMEQVRGWASEGTFLLGEINAGNGASQLKRDFTGPARLDAGYTVQLNGAPLSAPEWADLITEAGCDGMAWLMSSHDVSRAVSRLGDGSARDARLLLMLLLSLPGHAILYQGEELGLPQPALPRGALVDPYDRMYWPDMPGRDGARVPLPWQAGAPASGFTSGAPWLPIPEDWDKRAIDSQADDPQSTLSFARRMLALRRAEVPLHAGGFRAEARDGNVLVITRTTSSGSLRAVFNLAEKAAPGPLPAQEPLLATAPLGAESLPPRTGFIERLS
jgi:alpha-glucosidase